MEIVRSLWSRPDFFLWVAIACLLIFGVAQMATEIRDERSAHVESGLDAVSGPSSSSRPPLWGSYRSSSKSRYGSSTRSRRNPTRTMTAMCGATRSLAHLKNATAKSLIS